MKGIIEITNFATLGILNVLHDGTYFVRFTSFLHEGDTGGIFENLAQSLIPHT